MLCSGAVLWQREMTLTISACCSLEEIKIAQFQLKLTLNWFMCRFLNTEHSVHCFCHPAYPTLSTQGYLKYATANSNYAHLFYPFTPKMLEANKGI